MPVSKQTHKQKIIVVILIILLIILILILLLIIIVTEIFIRNKWFLGRRKCFL
jgi:Ca2+/Na+ antiporter